MVLGAGVDKYNSYAQRGSFPVPEHMLAAAVDYFRFCRVFVCCVIGAVLSMLAQTHRIISKLTLKAFILTADGEPVVQGNAWLWPRFCRSDRQ